MREYIPEYNLELSRESSFQKYPSRLNSIYLFMTGEEAQKYSDLHKWHVGDRILKKCHSIGPCIYSVHDSSWVDFLRLSHALDAESIDNVGNAYWTGKRVKDFKLQSMGKPWTQDPIWEALFMGRVEFYDRDLTRP